MKLPVRPLLGSGINAPDMRSVNAIQLLNLLREHGPISRAGLARLSGLSKPAVSEQVNRLITLGMVLETGVGEASEAGGKRPTMLAFHADAGRVAGIGIGTATIRIALSNLQGTIRDSVEIATLPEQAPRTTIRRTVRALEGLLARTRLPLQAIGIGVPGRVDCRAGKVLEAGGLFDWRDVVLSGPFEERFGCPVAIDNDVNVRLMAELHRGGARGARTAVLLHADTGIGSAVAIDRYIHHGTHWAAGEIGHLAYRLPAVARVSPRGQLESLLASDQIARRVRAAGRTSLTLRALLRTLPELEALITAAAEKDTAARKLAAELSGLASVAVANQALAYDPDVVLLSGGLFAAFTDDIRKFLARTVPWSTDVQMASFGEEGVQAGAVDMALLAAYDGMSRSLYVDPPAQRAAAGA